MWDFFFFFQNKFKNVNCKLWSELAINTWPSKYDLLNFYYISIKVMFYSEVINDTVGFKEI